LEIWFGEVPSVSHLWVWGCKVLYQIPKAKRRKINYKAKEGIFVGYEATSKHYKVYDSSSSQLITVRDVVFYEDMRLSKVKPNPAVGTCWILDGNLEFQDLSRHVI